MAVCLFTVIHHSFIPHARHCTNERWRYTDSTCCSCPKGAHRLRVGGTHRRLLSQFSVVGVIEKLWMKGQERREFQPGPWMVGGAIGGIARAELAKTGGSLPGGEGRKTFLRAGTV